MSSTGLQQPVLEGGIRSINFFNGRLLTGEDLSKEQDANREGRRRLGLAIGGGIAFGLEVSATLGVNQKTAPTVTVAPGLAVNRQGQTLELPDSTDVSLMSPANTLATATPPTSVSFGPCLPSAFTGEGVYLLTIAPAAGSEGKAQVSGLGNVTAPCNTRYLIEGVQFRLLSLTLSLDVLNDRDHLRNLVAYACFGTTDERVKSFLKDPFGPPLTSYGLLDDLHPNRLTDSEVPLAVLRWTVNNGLEFVDLWSVRRRIVEPDADERWPLLLSGRRVSEAEAMFFQFQDQLEVLRQAVLAPMTVIATQYFRYLPPVGFLPLATQGTAQAFTYQAFFQGLAYHNPLFIDGARVDALVRTALAYPPLDLGSKELIWLYLVRENQQNQGPPYLIFTNGHVPFQVEARYNLSYWNYSYYV